MRKVRADVKEPVNPLAPAELEALLATLSGRDRAIVLLAGHLELRPLEIRQVRWGDLRDGVLVVSAARTKRAAARTRVITVPAVTLAELKRWRMESGRPAEDEPIVGPMTDRALGLWGWKRLAPAIQQVTGRDGANLYLLRHTHASACHYAGFTVPEAAARLGHSGQVHLGIYAHVITTLSGRPHHADLDALIAAARAEVSSIAGTSGAEVALV